MIASKSADINLYEQFQSYTIDLIFPIYTQLGWQQSPSSKWLDALHRDLIISTACHYNLDDCVQHAQTLFQQWFNQPSINSIEANYRSVVYCTIVRLGSRKEFYFLLHQYRESNDPQEKARIQSALACTRDIELIRYLLEIHFDFQLNIIRRQDGLSGIRIICRNFIAETECWNVGILYVFDGNNYLKNSVHQLLLLILSKMSQHDSILNNNWTNLNDSLNRPLIQSIMNFKQQSNVFVLIFNGLKRQNLI